MIRGCVEACEGWRKERARGMKARREPGAGKPNGMGGNAGSCYRRVNGRHISGVVERALAYASGSGKSVVSAGQVFSKVIGG